MKSGLIFISLLLIFAFPGFSQKQNPGTEGLMKNSVYGTGGVWPEEMYGNVTINYERMLFEFPASFFQAINVRSGAGPWVAWLAEGINCFSVISLVTGRRGSHFETGMGVVFTYWTESKDWDPIVNDSHFAGNLGYRFQKPGGSFVFRTGLGWPEGFYLSLGFCF